MRELELREKKVNDIQATGDKLIKDGHAGKKTIEVITTVLLISTEKYTLKCTC